MSAKRIQTTISIDDELYDDARRYTGIESLSTLFEEGLRALIQREAANPSRKIPNTPEERLRRLSGQRIHLPKTNPD